MSETLGCGHPDKNRACGDCLDEAADELEVMTKHANEGWALANTRAAELREMRLQIDAEKRLYAQNDAYLRQQLKEAENSDAESVRMYTAARGREAEKDKELDESNRLNGELRQALWLIWRDPTKAEVQQATLRLLENLDKTEKRNCECVWLDGGSVGEYRDPAKKCPVHDKWAPSPSGGAAPVAHCYGAHCRYLTERRCICLCSMCADARSKDH